MAGTNPAPQTCPEPSQDSVNEEEDPQPAKAANMPVEEEMPPDPIIPDLGANLPGYTLSPEDARSPGHRLW
jgi:hypothetical protein